MSEVDGIEMNCFVYFQIKVFDGESKGAGKVSMIILICITTNGNTAVSHLYYKMW
jgi:hypothetical protein